MLSSKAKVRLMTAQPAGREENMTINCELILNKRKFMPVHIFFLPLPHLLNPRNKFKERQVKHYKIPLFVHGLADSRWSSRICVLVFGRINYTCWWLLKRKMTSRKIVPIAR